MDARGWQLIRVAVEGANVKRAEPSEGSSRGSRQGPSRGKLCIMVTELTLAAHDVSALDSGSTTESI